MNPVPPIRGRDIALLALIPLLILGVGLGQMPLFDVDEGAFSEATREMFERGDFLSTWLNGVPRFDKPILIYWLQAVPVGLFGPVEWAFRLPSVLAATVWAAALGVFAWPRLGREAAYLVSVITATSLGVFVIGRAATADALLNALLVLALTDAWRHLESGSRPALRRMYLWIGLGVLTKGPIALAIPAAVTLLYCASRRDWRGWARAAFDLPGWAILLAVAAPWYIAALSIHGQAFIDGFILKHNIGRFSGPMEGHGGSLFYYALIVPLLLLPWTAQLLRALPEIRRDASYPLARLLWIWAGFVVVFFSLSGTKLPHYALYGCSPLFLLLAAHRAAPMPNGLRLLPAFLLLAFCVILPALLDHAVGAGWVRDPYYAAQLGRAASALPAHYLPACGTVFGLALAVALFWRGPGWQRLALVAAAQGLLLATVVGPYVADLLQGPVKRAALAARQAGGPAVQWNFFQPSFAVYRQQVAPARAPLPGELAITRYDRIPPGARVELLYSEGGVRLVRALP